MEIFYSSDKAELRKRLFTFSKEIIENNEFPSVGLCGGRSISYFLDIFKKENYSLLKTHFFLVDERCVPISDSNSNFKILNDNFFESMVKKNLISSSNIHPFIYDKDDELNSIYDYTLDFNSRFNNFDLVFLSVGEDGHIASIFPSRKLLFSELKGYQYEDDSPKPPSKRVTLTPESLKEADSIVLFFIGEDKKEALDNFLNSEIAIKNCPAKLLQEHSNLLILTNIEGEYGRS